MWAQEVLSFLLWQRETLVKFLQVLEPVFIINGGNSYLRIYYEIFGDNIWKVSGI